MLRHEREKQRKKKQSSVLFSSVLGPEHWRSESAAWFKRAEEEPRTRWRGETRAGSASDVGWWWLGGGGAAIRQMLVKRGQVRAGRGGGGQDGRRASEAVKTHPDETKREGGEEGAAS